MKKTSAVLFGIQTLALATSLTASTAWADTATATSSNLSATTIQPSSLSKIMEKVGLSYTAYYNGPGLTGLNQDINPQYTSKSDSLSLVDSSQNLDSFIGLTYKINPNLVVGASDEVKTYFEPSADGSATTVYSPYVRLNLPHLVQKGGLNINSDILRVYLPIADDMQKAGLATILRTQYYVTYDIPKTRVSVGVLPAFRFYIHSRPETAADTDFRMTFSAFANYQLSEKVAATLWTDWVDARHYVNSGFDLANLSKAEDAADVQPGLSWDVTKAITLNPYISIFPKNPTLASTSVNMIISAKVF